MNGWLVINGFLNSNKFNEIYEWLRIAFEGKGHVINVYTNIELADIDEIKDKPDFVLFWDKDIPLAKRLEKMGLRLFNSAKAIENCDNKALTYIELEGMVKMPETVIVPMTYRNIGYGNTDFVKKAADKLGLPMIIKECYGSFGQQVYLAESVDEAVKIVEETREPLIFQEFISQSRGRDIRINMVGQEAVASMIRYNESDFRANITNGGSMYNYEPNDDEIKIAKKAADILNLDFGGIDILFGDDGPLICEVNSNAHFKNIYECTGVNVAECIVEYIEKCLAG
ncbi:MAG: RimK family alpha-L-glutamate ligase [Clostridia bacterium]|nr:RimK family alpha-L-glutamate ligase [Clostridia bacterium]